MGYYTKGHIRPIRLLAIAFCAAVFVAGIELSKTSQRDPLLDDKLAAAHLMERAMSAIRRARQRLGIHMDPKNDPNETGLIGKEFTDLTTTLGSLSSKRTSTNPNITGILVDLLLKANLKRGDHVAVSFSGSFPALNIALLSTVRILGLNPVIISSVGASTYGANEAHLTWLDMERILRENHVFPYRSEAASLGGLVDSVGGLEGKGTEIGIEAIRRNGIPCLDEQGEETLQEDVERRMAIYQRSAEGHPIAAFVNIGGSLTSLGTGPEALSLSTGFLSKVPASTHPQRGLIFRMNERGIPVIHLLNIKKIAARYGLPIDPVPLPPIPNGRIMKPQRYPPLFVLSGLTVLSLLLFVLRKAMTPTRTSGNPTR